MLLGHHLPQGVLLRGRSPSVSAVAKARSFAIVADAQLLLFVVALHVLESNVG
jgi:hypothetical protein